MIFQIRHIKTGAVAVIDNTGEVNGQVKISGDESISTALDRYLNREIYIQHRDMLISLKKIFSEVCFIRGNGTQLYKASDMFMRSYFIPVFCPIHGYEVLNDNFSG